VRGTVQAYQIAAVAVRAERSAIMDA